MIAKVGDFQSTDLVLDVGTGTGIIANLISALVGEVIGLDKSQDMLEQSNWGGNRHFIRRDILDPMFKENTFDKITARMVFHHIIGSTQAAMDECYRILKLGGKMILAEGVPPDKSVKKDYIRIFELKEKRLTFLEEDLFALMENSGFKNIKVHINIMRQMSVCNWLEKSGLPREIQDKIFEMHIVASENFKKAYNMKIIRGDCLIDMKNAILVGEK